MPAPKTPGAHGTPAPHHLGAVHRRDTPYSARREPHARPQAWRHRRLTNSPARTNLALFIHRAVRLIMLRVADFAAA